MNTEQKKQKTFLLSLWERKFLFGHLYTIDKSEIFHVEVPELKIMSEPNLFLSIMLIYCNLLLL